MQARFIIPGPRVSGFCLKGGNAFGQWLGRHGWPLASFLCLDYSLVFLLRLSLSYLLGFLLFDEVGAANPILSLLITRLRCNALQTILLFVENNTCICAEKKYGDAHRSDKRDETNKQKQNEIRKIYSN